LPLTEQAPPKKKLKTAPAAEDKAPRKNGTVANGDEEDEEGEGGEEEEEEFDEEDEEAEGEEEEEEGGDEEGELPTKGVGKVSAPSAGKAGSKAVAAGGDEED
jgi:hypothetical protein